MADQSWNGGGAGKLRCKTKNTAGAHLLRDLQDWLLEKVGCSQTPCGISRQGSRQGRGMEGGGTHDEMENDRRLCGGAVLVEPQACRPLIKIQRLDGIAHRQISGIGDLMENWYRVA